MNDKIRAILEKARMVEQVHSTPRIQWGEQIPIRVVAAMRPATGDTVMHVMVNHLSVWHAAIENDAFDVMKDVMNSQAVMIAMAFDAAGVGYELITL